MPNSLTDPIWNEHCEVCGWGNTVYPNYKPAEKLQCVDLPVLRNYDCNKSYRGAIHEHIMCIGLMAGGKDSCQVRNFKTRQPVQMNSAMTDKISHSSIDLGLIFQTKN